MTEIGTTKRPHPLASLVLDMLTCTTVVDVTDLAMALAGSMMYPAKCRKAYRIVAADVLGYMWQQGVLERHGVVENPRRPEDGGYWYTLAQKEAANVVYAHDPA